MQSVEYLSLTNFFEWLWKATFQGALIMILTLLIFQEQSYLEFETITFTVLILTEYFMTFTEITKLHLYLIICVLGSVLCYLLCLVFLGDYLHVSDLTLE